jgi:beta-lactamase class A
MSRYFLAALCVFAGAFTPCTGQQPEPLKATLADISSRISADIGVAIMNLETGDTLSLNGNRHYPMQSVFKFHLALAVLHRVERGELKLDQPYDVVKSDYFETWSVLMRTYPNANVRVTLRELVSWTAMNSDNVACDILFRLVGGPAYVEHFIKQLGIADIAIKTNEREMHRVWTAQFDNWTTPQATARLLQLFDAGKILTPEHSAFLRKLMVDTPNAPKRLKGLLPEGTAVVRKPGTGAHNKAGTLGAVNDVGILELPNGRKVIVAAFVTRTQEPIPVAEQPIAEIAKAVYDYYR